MYIYVCVYVVIICIIFSNLCYIWYKFNLKWRITEGFVWIFNMFLLPTCAKSCQTWHYHCFQVFDHLAESIYTFLKEENRLDSRLPLGELKLIGHISNIRAPLQWRHKGRNGISNHQPHDCLLNRLFRRGSKKTSKLRVTGLCAGNSPVTGEFIAQMASNAENDSIWWRHHELTWINIIPRMDQLSGRYKVGVDIAYPFPDFNGCSRWIWEWVRNFIPNFTGHVALLIRARIILKHVSKKGDSRFWTYSKKEMAL